MCDVSGWSTQDDAAAALAEAQAAFDATQAAARAKAGNKGKDAKSGAAGGRWRMRHTAGVYCTVVCVRRHAVGLFWCI